MSTYNLRNNKRKLFRSFTETTNKPRFIPYGPVPVLYAGL